MPHDLQSYLQLDTSKGRHRRNKGSPVCFKQTAMWSRSTTRRTPLNAATSVWAGFLVDPTPPQALVAAFLFSDMPYKMLKCEHCGDEFEGWHNTKYCSDECGRADRSIGKQCQQCGRQFQIRPSKAEDRKYCSMGCKGKAQRKRITLQCEECGQDFEVTPYKADSQKYCSRKCHSKAQRNRVRLECNECGEGFVVKRSDADRRKYCSKQCMNKDKRDRVKLRCRMCGDNFEIQKHKAQDRYYCSTSCWQKAQKEWVTLKCMECGSNFKGKPNEITRRKYCSTQCNSRAQKNRVTLKCKECKNSFEVKRSKLKQGRKYCSRDCKYRAERLAPEDIDDYRRKAVAEGENVREQIPEMMAEQDGKCAYCGTDITEGFHLDHKIPLARGGEHICENAHLTCPSCNQQKNSMTHEEYLHFRYEQAKTKEKRFVQAELAFS